MTRVLAADPLRSGVVPGRPLRTAPPSTAHSLVDQLDQNLAVRFVQQAPDTLPREVSIDLDLQQPPRIQALLPDTLLEGLEADLQDLQERTVTIRLDLVEDRDLLLEQFPDVGFQTPKPSVPVAAEIPGMTPEAGRGPCHGPIARNRREHRSQLLPWSLQRLPEPEHLSTHGLRTREGPQDRVPALQEQP